MDDYTGFLSWKLMACGTSRKLSSNCAHTVLCYDGTLRYKDTKKE